MIVTEEYRSPPRKTCPSATVANINAGMQTIIFSYLNAVLGDLSKTKMTAYSNS